MHTRWEPGPPEIPETPAEKLAARTDVLLADVADEVIERHAQPATVN